MSDQQLTELTIIRHPFHWDECFSGGLMLFFIPMNNEFNFLGKKKSILLFFAIEEADWNLSSKWVISFFVEEQDLQIFYSRSKIDWKCCQDFRMVLHQVSEGSIL